MALFLIYNTDLSKKKKSRIRWLKEGDKCTKFFHQVANANRRNNSIESLVVNGTPSSDPSIVSNHIVNFYESLFTEPLGWRPRLDNLEFDKLSNSEALSLEEPFEEREVWEVIKGMDGDKAPGWVFYGILSGVLGGDQRGLYGGLCRLP
jgi:hypothetical protein